MTYNVFGGTLNLCSVNQLYNVGAWLCVCVYHSFMWQMCSYIPTTLPTLVSVMASKLSASFILETLIHSKEKVGRENIISVQRIDENSFNSVP